MKPETGLLPALLILFTALTAWSETTPTSDRVSSQMRRVLEALAALHPKPIDTLPATLARLQPSPADAVLEVLQEKGEAAPEPITPVGRIETTLLPGTNGSLIAARVYTPPGKGPFPIIVYYHGGGWVLASPEAYDASARALSSKVEAVVVSVDYRRAPEHKFPTAHEDSYAALQHVVQNAHTFKGNRYQVAVAGESAGGNLATAVCLMAKSRNGRMPVHQALIYPVTDYSFDTQSYREHADAKPLNMKMMRWFFNQYLNSPEDGESPLVSPYRLSTAELAGLPPATVITAEIDPLETEGMAYAKKLKAAGVDVAMKKYEGVTHEFFGMAAVVDEAADAQSFVAKRLKHSLNAEKPR